MHREHVELRPRLVDAPVRVPPPVPHSDGAEEPRGVVAQRGEHVEADVATGVLVHHEGAGVLEGARGGVGGEGAGVKLERERRKIIQ